MPTKNINLTDHFSDFVDQLVASGQYKNASEVVRLTRWTRLDDFPWLRPRLAQTLRSAQPLGRLLGRICPLGFRSKLAVARLVAPPQAIVGPSLRD